ncbi:Acid protease [Purpureocillium lavendulum]|uniref:Acid protease n=1 Tax=Purpureocillium lavendulum TaxID=1247861 RepID=A0AB34FLR9_9HYPO|nr:Acid protease [Purpureocillium lavendulum]
MRIPLLAGRASDPAPVAVSASQFFEGIDGPWSTFELRVGTPAQNIRFLPGTSSTLTTVVLPEGCQGQPKECAENRGGAFNKTASSTWDEIGLFGLGFEKGLGYSDNGDFGHDTVGLGYLGSGGPVVNNSVVAGVAGSEFYLAVLGLKPEPTNFTTQNDPQPSFMQLLKKEAKIPSLSYSYTAGAPYRLNKALGSLILGGYDTSKFQDTNKTHTLLSDQSRDITVGIKSITTNATGSDNDSNLLPSGLISSYIDSSIAELYLPLDACKAFEKAFGLNYNDTAEMYLVDDKLHDKLTKNNPSVTLSITAAIEGGDTFDVTLPYASFDLQAKPPLVKNATRYFPLKRAANDTQYTLGRTFLQEAYLIVDYERSTFAVHPRVWNASAVSHIVPLLPPSAETSTPPQAPDANGESGLSAGAIAGASVGAIAAFVLIIVLPLWFFLIVPRRRRAAEFKNKEAEQTAASSSDGNDAAAAGAGETPTDQMTAEIEGDRPTPEVEGDKPTPEVEGDRPTPEVEGSKPTPEVEGSTPTPEVQGSEPTEKGTMQSDPHSSSSPQPAELFTPPPELLGVEIHEMPGSDVPELPGDHVRRPLSFTRSSRSSSMSSRSGEFWEEGRRRESQQPNP